MRESVSVSQKDKAVLEQKVEILLETIQEYEEREANKRAIDDKMWSALKSEN